MIFFPGVDGEGRGNTFAVISKPSLEMMGGRDILAGDDIISGDDQGRGDLPGQFSLTAP